MRAVSSGVCSVCAQEWRPRDHRHSLEIQALPRVIYFCLVVVLVNFSCISRCLGQIRRKLHLTTHYPMTDQSQWLSGALCALANLSIGFGGSSCASPSTFSVKDVTTIPISFDGQPETVTGSTISADLDVHPLFTSDWVRQLLFDVSDYIVSLQDGQLQQAPGEELSPTQSSILALLLLGIRREKLLSEAVPTMSRFADLLVAESSALLAPPDAVLTQTLQPLDASTEPSRHLGTLSCRIKFMDLVHCHWGCKRSNGKQNKKLNICQRASWKVG